MNIHATVLHQYAQLIVN